jgi:hypothetical protein
MSTLKVTTIQDASGGNTATINSMTPTADSLQGFRNRIINGDMRIDQRNAGASVTNIAGYVYCIDRWVLGASQASKFTAQQNAGSVTPPAGFSNYLGATSSSAYTVGTSEQFWIIQRIEGFNTADLAWGTANAQTVTLSFWVRSSLTGTFGGSIYNSDANYSYPFSYSIASANTWTKISLTITGPTAGTWVGSTNGIGIQINFSLGAGATSSGTAGAWSSNFYASSTGATSVVGTSGATFYITGVQLEVGSVATPFERRDYGRELIMCQRYYYVSSTDNGGGAQFVGAPISGALSIAVGQGRFPVSMRAAPTVALPSGAGQSGLVADSNCTASQIGVDAFIRVTIDSGNWSNSYTPVQGRFTASAEL